MKAHWFIDVGISFKMHTETWIGRVILIILILIVHVIVYMIFTND